jgi:hypothetical protein
LTATSETKRGAARGGDAGASQLAAQGRGDRLGFSIELSGKAAGKHLASVFVGGGRWGASAGTLVASWYTSRSTGRVVYLGADGPTPSSSARGFLRTPLLAGAGRDPENAEILRTPHLTGSGRLWMARERMMLLRGGGHVVRRGWRSPASGFKIK